MVKAGDPAPDFELPDQTGERVRLSSFRGRPVVLYFYPKDFTSGCTTEAREFASVQDELERRGVVVLGVSADSVESHRKFSERLGVKFRLLSDPERKVIEAYGARAGGRTRRMTFIIDREGRIAHVFPAVKPAGHAAEVLRKLEELGLI
ncbi:MAG: peroxiredoxin [Nitrososphaeria archaeon]